jgi:uncharacterized protein YjbI with pentapeptide repeats
MSQDFSHQKLQGRSFAHTSLAHHTFIGADIRGVDFQSADLRNADFSHVKAGPTRLMARLQTLLKILLVFLSGIAIACSGVIVGHLYVFASSDKIVLGIGITHTLICFGFITCKKGLGSALGLISLATASLMIISFALAPSEHTSDQISMGALAIGGTIAGIVGVAQVITWTRRRLLPLIGTIVGILFGGLITISMETPGRDLTGCLLMSIACLSLANYMGQKAMINDERYRIISDLTIALASIGGTSFKGANLANANFSNAKLTSTNFQDADLTHVCWRGADISRAKGDRTYLENPIVRQLLVTGDGQRQDFSKLDLRLVNLNQAKLAQATLVGTDLTNATLQQADLTGANLCHAQLHGTDLSQSNLTGAWIENWGISTETKFQDLTCDYVFTHWPTEANRNPGRKPNSSNAAFKPGDFVEFIAPLIKVLNYTTLDLIHHDGIDPTAAAIAMIQLTEAHPEAKLSLVSLDGRGNDKIRLQAIVDDESDQSQLYDEYFQNYQQLQTLPYNDIQSIFMAYTERGNYIRSLESMLGSAIQQPKFHIETNRYSGDITMSDNRGGLNISNVQGNISGLAVAGGDQVITGSLLGVVSGTLSQSLNNLPSEEESPEKPSVKHLLQQLQSAIESDQSLPDDEKADALKQVQAIADGKQQKDKPEGKKMAKNAITFLKGMVSNVPASEFGKVAGKLLPLIAGCFGI